MANKLISELTQLGTVVNGDWLEVEEFDNTGTTKKATVEAVTAVERAARVAQDNVIEAAVGLNADGTYNTPSGTNYLDSTTDVMDALETLDGIIASSGVGIQIDIVDVSAANLNNCGVTPYQLIAAPGADFAIELISVVVALTYNGTAPTWASGSPKLVIQYDTGASHTLEWSNAFITATADTIAYGTWTSNVTIKENKKVELTFDTGTNPTGGDTAIRVILTYKGIATPAVT